jgi:opacity protein-like surface antigen
LHYQIIQNKIIMKKIAISMFVFVAVLTQAMAQKQHKAEFYLKTGVGVPEGKIQRRNKLYDYNMVGGFISWFFFDEPLGSNHPEDHRVSSKINPEMQYTFGARFSPSKDIPVKLGVSYSKASFRVTNVWKSGYTEAKTETITTVMPELHIQWIRNNQIEVYSGGGLGISTIRFHKNKESGYTTDKGLALQFNVLGLKKTWGNVGANLELGCGQQGVISGGLVVGL